MSEAPGAIVRWSRPLARMVIALVGLLLASPATAAVVYLTSGGRLEIQAWREVGDDIEVNLEGGTFRFPKGDVVRIERSSSSGAASAPYPSSVARPTATLGAKSPSVEGRLAPARPTSPPSAKRSPIPDGPISPTQTVATLNPKGVSSVESPPPPARPTASSDAKELPSPESSSRAMPAKPLTPPAAAPVGDANPPLRPLTTMVAGRALDEWRRDLASPAIEVRRRAVSVLAQVADGSVGAVASVLAPALRDADPGVRLTAAVAMATSGQEPSTITTVLRSALTARDPALRRAGSMGLMRMGPAAKDAAPVLLLAFVDDPDAMVRQNAARALLQIGLAAKEIVPGLTGALRHRDPEVRRAAAMILTDLGTARGQEAEYAGKDH